MKKVLALVLAFAMVFSSISFVFAEDVVSDEAAALSTIGMLEGDGGGVTVEYETKELNKLTGAIMILKLKGLYEEALEYDGVDNFEDAEEVKWEEGRNILAYLKDNPAVGFIGSEGKFGPTETLSEQMFYKVLLENLGYKQVTADVADGDFAWEETLEFAEGLGLVPANPEVFTIGELSKAVVAALKTNIKDGKAWIEVLVENEKVALDDAVAAGFMAEAPGLVEAEVKEVKAIGNTVVEVKFKEAVGEEAENLDNYEIDGLDIVDAAIEAEKVIRLETAAQTKGKIYFLKIGENSFKFTGLAKVSGAPAIDKVVSEDVDEVVITFTKKIDLATGTDVENFSIAGVDVVEAEVDGEDVILTTEGLKNKTDYTVKVTNIKSIDGVAKRADSKKFKTRFDFSAPGIKGNIEVETNQRIIVNFTEKVTQESAEELENYTIVRDVKDGEELEILSITWDDDDEDNVEIETEPMEKNKDYKLTVVNIEDQRKVANVMTRPVSRTFKAKAEDNKAPAIESAKAISPTTVLVKFKDDSRFDEDSLLDYNNYYSDDIDIETVELLSNKKIDGKYYAKVLLEVEEMEFKKTYNIEIADIADEFGNAMDSKKNKVTLKESDLESAKVTNAVATKESEVEVTFNKELDKATAEDISNYEIDNDIGAPLKAKLDEKTNIVTLTTNKLKNSWDDYYELTVDGVEDASGNELYFDEYPIDTKTKVWDEENPELEDVQLLNKFVLALTFNEEVKFTKEEEAYVSIYECEEEDGKIVKVKNEIKLFAKERVDDNDVVEFSNYKAEDFVAETTVTYAVYEVKGITDLMGLKVDAFDFGDFTFDSTDEDDDPDVVEMDDYEQVNGAEFKVWMSRNVKFAEGVNKNNVKTIDNKTSFTVKIDNDDPNIVTFTLNNASKQNMLEEEKEYKFKFNEIFVDYHGIEAGEVDYETDASKDPNCTILEGEFKDEDKPYAEEVVVKNRFNIELVFDEKIAVDSLTTTSHFEVWNYDLDKKVNISKAEVSGKKVKIELAKPLEARYEYELRFIDTKVVKDLVGNEWKFDSESSFYFDGTNLAD